jgi:hypothetical protein
VTTGRRRIGKISVPAKREVTHKLVVRRKKGVAPERRCHVARPRPIHPQVIATRVRTAAGMPSQKARSRGKL